MTRTSNEAAFTSVCVCDTRGRSLTPSGRGRTRSVGSPAAPSACARVFTDQRQTTQLEQRLPHTGAGACGFSGLRQLQGILLKDEIRQIVPESVLNTHAPVQTVLINYRHSLVLFSFTRTPLINSWELLLVFTTHHVFHISGLTFSPTASL